MSYILQVKPALATAAFKAAFHSGNMYIENAIQDSIVLTIDINKAEKYETIKAAKVAKCVRESWSMGLSEYFIVEIN